MNRRFVKRLLGYGIVVSCSVASLPLLLSKDSIEENQHSFFLWSLEGTGNETVPSEQSLRDILKEEKKQSEENSYKLLVTERIPQNPSKFAPASLIRNPDQNHEIAQNQLMRTPSNEAAFPVNEPVQEALPSEAVQETGPTEPTPDLFPTTKQVPPSPTTTTAPASIPGQTQPSVTAQPATPTAPSVIAPAQPATPTAPSVIAPAQPATPTTTAPASIPGQTQPSVIAPAQPATPTTPSVIAPAQPTTPTAPSVTIPAQPIPGQSVTPVEITPLSLPQTTPQALPRQETIQQAPAQEVQPVVTPVQEVRPPAGGQPTTSTAEELEARRAKAISINFTNVSAVEMVRFVSRITNRNFLFDETDLQFNLTIVSEEPATVDTIMTAFLQELRVHGLNVLEINNTFIIHKNPDVKGIGKVETTTPEGQQTAELITRLFLLNTLDPDKAANIVRPMVSAQALVEASKETRHLIVTDIAANIEQIDELLKGLDSPVSGMNIGQYVVKNTFMATLVDLTQKLMAPIVQDQHYVLVPHAGANSIFIVSTPFLVDKTISLLQRLDQIQGTTGAYGLEELKFKGKAAAKTTAPEGAPKNGQWELDEHGNWIFKPVGGKFEANELPRGKWLLDSEGNWYFQPEGAEKLEGSISHEGITSKEAPKGYWKKDANGNWIFELGAGETINAQALTRIPQIAPELPLGHIERTRFYIHKLRYRRGEQIVRALQKVGESLALSGTSNEELVAAINSIQWIEASNVLVLTGTVDTIDKMRELTNEIDIPLRQVFIEMLMLETTIDDSLLYGVQWSVHSGGGLTSTNENFIQANSTLPAGMNTTLFGGLPNANPLTPSQGFAAGIIGTVLSHNGTIFHSIGALVTAIHDNTKINILLNPKLLVEDNATAEIFVGINTQFQTQSIVNEQGSIVTNNFEFRDVGTRFKVTPIIGPDGLITMDVEQETSDLAPTTTTLVSTAGSGTLGLANIQPGPTTRKSKSVTKVHVPNGYFMVFSGMIQDAFLHRRENLPCLGGLPVIGGLFAHKDNELTKRNIIIFLRPIIVDTDEQIDNITKHQQDIYKIYRRNKSLWKYEVEEGLDFLNLINTDCESDCPDPA